MATQASLTKLGRKTLTGVLITLVIIGACINLTTFLVFLGLLFILGLWEATAALAAQKNKRFRFVYYLYLLLAGTIVCLCNLARSFAVWYCFILCLTICLIDAVANLWGSFWVHTLRRPTAHFAPTWSPNKTWAGAWAGLLTGTLGFPLIIWVSHLIWQPVLTNNDVFTVSQPLLHPGAYAWGFTIAWLAEMGDLIFSWCKRHLELKDFSLTVSGHTFCLLGSHGGVLDRLDSWSLPSLLVFPWLALTKMQPQFNDFAVFLPLITMTWIASYRSRSH